MKRMLETYRTIYCDGTDEIVEKKSRFIAHIGLAETEEEALAFVERIKKRYWDARHNCYAFRIGTDRVLERCSDDGEPSGTAGKPMLEVLVGQGLYNTVAVVTRYFGGTLLGTGGLVRAYSRAVQEGLAQSDIIEKIYGAILQIETDYNGLGKIQYLIGERKIPVLESEYTDKVVLRIILPVGEVEKIQAELVEATNGKVITEVAEKLYYAVLNGNVLMGEELRG